MSRNTWGAVALLLAALTVTSTAFAQGRGRGGGGGGSPFGNYEPRIDKLEDGLYMLRSPASGNITVFMSDDGLLFVDTKFENEYMNYMAMLRSVTDLPVKYVINTHQHGDHTGSNVRLEMLGPTIIATENTRRGLAGTQAAGLPSVTFDDHMRVYFGGRTMDLYTLGSGHTNGDLVIHLPEERLILTGDLFAGGDPFVTLIDYNAGGSLAEWAGTLEKVLALDFDRVIPGHAEPTDRAHVQAYHDELARMRDLIRDMARAGRAATDIQQAVTTEFPGRVIVFLPNIQAAIDELK